MTATAIDTPTRAEILRDIAEHELQLFELRELLKRHPAIKTFFHFRCEPQRHCFVYAENREQANQRLRERMDKSYGPDGWRVTSTVVKEYHSATEASLACSDNLLRCLGDDEAKEFLADWESEKAGKVADPDRPKHSPKSSLEVDIENYRLREQRLQKR